MEDLRKAANQMEHHPRRGHKQGPNDPAILTGYESIAVLAGTFKWDIHRNTKTVMIANGGPADYKFYEMMNALRYESHAKNI